VQIDIDGNRRRSPVDDFAICFMPAACASDDLGKHHLAHRRNLLLEGKQAASATGTASGHTEGKNMMTNVNHQALKSLSCFAAVVFSTSQMCTYECFLNTNAMNVLYFLSIVSKPLFL
jgi:hypothetical protein